MLLLIHAGIKVKAAPGYVMLCYRALTSSRFGNALALVNQNCLTFSEVTGIHLNMISLLNAQHVIDNQLFEFLQI